MGHEGRLTIFLAFHICQSKTGGLYNYATCEGNKAWTDTDKQLSVLCSIINFMELDWTDSGEHIAII